MRFTTAELAIELLTKTLRSGNFLFLPIYLEIRNVIVRIGKILTKIKVVWLVFAVLAATKEDSKLITVRIMEQVNWWGSGMEVFIRATCQDTEDQPFEIVILEENLLKVIVEGRRPKCYLFGEKEVI